MIRDTIILQQIYRQGSYVEIMELTLGRHLRYARQHRMDYEFTFSDVVDKWEMGYGGWAKLHLILKAMERGYRRVIWLGADTIIADMEADLREACPKREGIGVVEHYCPMPAYNVDCLYITSTFIVYQFFAEWTTWYPGPVFPGSWHEQAMFQLFARIPFATKLIYKLPAKWNSCRKGNNHVEDAVVEGFHGDGSPENRIKLMKEYLMLRSIEC